jgi:hypothetical protein
VRAALGAVVFTIVEHIAADLIGQLDLLARLPDTPFSDMSSEVAAKPSTPNCMANAGARSVGVSDAVESRRFGNTARGRKTATYFVQLTLPTSEIGTHASNRPGTGR